MGEKWFDFVKSKDKLRKKKIRKREEAGKDSEGNYKISLGDAMKVASNNKGDWNKDGSSSPAKSTGKKTKKVRKSRKSKGKKSKGKKNPKVKRHADVANLRSKFKRKHIHT